MSSVNELLKMRALELKRNSGMGGNLPVVQAEYRTSIAWAAGNKIPGEREWQLQ